MVFKAEILGKNDKVMYRNNLLATGEETHFSFNNTDSQEVVLHITALPGDEKLPVTPGEIQLKFESMADTFNTKVSKEVQYKPAINALNHLLEKLNSITVSTKEMHSKSGDLRIEQKRMFSFVLGFSVLSLCAFAAFNFFQLYLIKSYLNEKKYL